MSQFDLAFLSSSSSDDDDNEHNIVLLIEAELLKQLPKNEFYSESTVALFNDDEFRMHFRYVIIVFIIY